MTNQLFISEYNSRVEYSNQFAFVEHSGTMKAPVGLLSDRTVLRKQDGGAPPRQLRVCGAMRNNESPRAGTCKAVWRCALPGGFSVYG